MEASVARSEKKLLHGTLDTLIMKTLSHGARHGYSIARWIENETGDAILVEEGSLYPALYRLEKKGFLGSEWGMSELERRAKFYSLTPQGASALAAETAAWLKFSSAVTAVLMPGS
jgi:PadR family transcriptional regulator PadR